MRTPHRQWWISACTGLLVITVHALLVTPLVLGAVARKRPVTPDMPGAGASASRKSAQLVEAMTLVDLSQSQQSSEPALEEFSSLGIELPQASLIVASPDLVPMPVLDPEAVEDSETTEGAGDTEGHALMFGRYLGQITARIERAWMRPRTDIGAPQFSCQAKIEQGPRGEVHSVELRQCNGDLHWQRSLVTAIEHASPLPSPPTPSVFASTLVLDFSAGPYLAGVSDDSEYEPQVRLASARGTAPVSTEVEKTMADLSRYQGAIDLRIEGNTIRWAPQGPPPEDGASGEDSAASLLQVGSTP